MNAVQMLTSHMPDTMPNMDDAKETGKLSLFQNMLDELFVNNEQSEIFFHPLQLANQKVSSELLEQLNLLSKDNDYVASLMNSDTQGYLMNEILLDFLKLDSSNPVFSHAESMIEEMGNNLITNEHIHIEQNSELIDIQIISLFNEVEEVLTNLKQDGNFTDAAPKLLDLLERWSTIHKLGNNQTNDSSHRYIVIEDDDIDSIWRHLFENFQRRSKFSLNNTYGGQAKVDQKDIVKWLQNAMQDYTADRPIDKSNVWQTILPMSRIEQHVIHVQQDDRLKAPPIDQQLIDKFQQMMRTNRFLSMNNGVNQMLFNLKPENLGEMMVRLTEVNGEMTVKILVTSNITKKALQSNIHQLKNMFLPHQVVIEKQDELTTQHVHDEQDHSREHEEQLFEKQNEHEQENSDLHEDDETFHEILNEKV